MEYVISTDQVNYNVSAERSGFAVYESVPELYIFEYTADGSTVDTSKFTVVNDDPDLLKLYQNNGLRVERIRNGFGSSILRNAFFSVNTFTTGVFKMSAVVMNNYVQSSSSYMSFGLVLDIDNIVLFENRPLYDNQISCTIKKTGESDIDLGSILNKWLANVKIIVTDTTITVYYWSADSWIKLLDTQNVNIGEFKVFVGSRGNNVGYINLKDIYVTENDFINMNP